MTDPIRIMGIYAHPADLATEAAGTMAIHADRGDVITAVVLSDGIRMHPHYLQGTEGRQAMTLAQYREFKRDEVRRAAHILGIEATEFMGWDENFWDASDQRVEALARLIAMKRPDVIVTHYPVGAHLIDSNAFTGVCAVRAIGLASALVPEIDGVAGHYVKETFFFLMDQSIDTRYKIDPGGVVADFYVDITSVIDRKVQAFDQYVSQGYEGPMARKTAEARDGRVGMLANAAYAEAFLTYRGATYPALPLPDAVMNRTYVPNDLPGIEVTAWQTPSATPPEAYRLRR